jgi:hypothetical protein
VGQRDSDALRTEIDDSRIPGSINVERVISTTVDEVERQNPLSRISGFESGLRVTGIRKTGLQVTPNPGFCQKTIPRDETAWFT